MEQNKPFSEEKIKKSFEKVKEDLFLINKEFKDKFKLLDDKIDKINLFLDKIDRKIDYSEFKEENKLLEDEVSSGNEGVHQQSSTMINDDQRSSTVNDQRSTMPNNPKQSQTVGEKKGSLLLKQELADLNRDISRRFQTLTDREFSVFSTVHTLQSQNEDITYTLLANMLNLTEPTIRGTINRLIVKGLPLQKERLFNRKTSLFIKKDFFELNLLNKLIALRSNTHEQKTLFDV